MRIGAFHNTFGEGGARRVFYHFVKGLSSRGHTIDVHTFDSTVENMLPVSDFAANRYTYVCPPHRAEEKTVFASIVARNAYARRLQTTYRTVAEKIDRHNYDVVYVDICKYTLAPYLLRYLKTPSVFFSHNPARRLRESDASGQVGSRFRELFSRKALDEAYRAWARREERLNAACADRIVTNSKFTRSCILKAYAREAIVNYLGVDTEVFRPLGLKRENVVLSVGGIQQNKRFDEIVDALARCDASRRPDLLIVGNRSNPRVRERLVQQAESMGVRLLVREKLSQEELVRSYNEAIMVVCTPYREPFGFVPLEAMACGTPVVGVAEGGLLESIRDGETGLLVQRDEVQLARAINALLSDGAMRDELSRRGVEDVAMHWTWERAVSEFERHLQEVVATRSCGKAS